MLPAAGDSAGWRSLYPFASHWLPVGPHRLHYVDEGPRDTQPLLLVHGNPTWSFYWRELIRGFRDERRVIAPDHMGCGLSDKPQDWAYRLADHVHNLSRLVTALDLRNVTLGVHDWGGAIGLGMAVRHPERIRRLVIFNTAAFRATALPWRLAVCRWPVVGPLLVRGLNGFCLAATVMATQRGLRGAVREGYLAPYGSWHNRVAVLRFVQDIPFEPGHPSYPTLVEIEEGLTRLAQRPTLIVWGERDWVFTPAFRREFERRFPGARSVPLAAAGHLVVEDAPERVSRELRDFLAAGP